MMEACFNTWLYAESAVNLWSVLYLGSQFCPVTY